MKLHGTRLSHFARKNRILLDLLEIPYEFVDLGNIAEGDLERFARNPLMRVPVLEDGETWLIDSDEIAGHIVRRYDPSDRYRVVTASDSDRNMRSVLNGIMSEEVTIIIARRTGIPTDQYPMFQDGLEVIRQGLEWLEERAGEFTPATPGYREFHLVCAWEHLEYFEIVSLEYPRLKAVVARVQTIAGVKRTAPQTLRPKK